jgi:hypothetical protein
LDAVDGRILWQASNTYDDLAKAESAQDVAARRERCRGQLEAADRRIVALAQRVQTPPGDGDPKAKEELASLRKWRNEFVARLDEPSRWNPPRSHALTGYSTPTPVCDGRRVYALFGTGTAVCYDLEGARRWIVHVERPFKINFAYGSPHDHGHSASPLLCDGKLILHLDHVIALDAETGRVCWENDASARWASAIRLPQFRPACVVSGDGRVFRVRDGKLLATLLTEEQEYMAFTRFWGISSPVADGDAIYFVQALSGANKALKFKLPADSAEGGKPTQLWSAKLPGGNSCKYYASPVLHGGLLYATYAASYTGAGSIVVLDDADGRIVYEQKLPSEWGTPYASITTAGQHVCLAGDRGVVALLEPGREFRVLAVQTLGEPVRSTPVWNGSRLLVRGLKNLWCLGEEK